MVLSLFSVTVDADAVRLHQLTLRRQELLDRLHVVSGDPPRHQWDTRSYEYRPNSRILQIFR